MYALPFILFMRLHRAALDARRKDRTWRFLAWSAVVGPARRDPDRRACCSRRSCCSSAGLWWLAIPLLALFVVPVARAPIVASRRSCRSAGHRAAFWIGHFAIDAKTPTRTALVCAAWAHARTADDRGRGVDRRAPRHAAGRSAMPRSSSPRLLAAGARRCRRRAPADALDARSRRGPSAPCASSRANGSRATPPNAARGASSPPMPRAARFPPTALTYFLEGVAAHAHRRRRARRTRACCTRAGCSRRIAASPRRWLARAAPSVDAPPDASRSHAEPAAASARRCRARSPRTWGSRPQRRHGLADAVAAWDAALADADDARVDHPPRARARRAARRRRTRAPDVTRAVTDELARIAEAREARRAAGRGMVGDALARRLRHGRLDSLETGFSRWEDRRHDGRRCAPRSTSGASGSRCAPRTTRRSTAGGLELRRLAFPHAYKMGNIDGARGCGTRATSTRCRTRSSRGCSAKRSRSATPRRSSCCTRNSRLAVPTRTGRVGPAVPESSSVDRRSCRGPVAAELVLRDVTAQAHPAIAAIERAAPRAAAPARRMRRRVARCPAAALWHVRQSSSR